VLKELRLANEGSVAAQTAFHASCGTGCRITSGNTGSGYTVGRQGSHSSGSGSGYSGGGQGSGGGRWKKKGRCGSNSRGGQKSSAPPAGLWYCYAPLDRRSAAATLASADTEPSLAWPWGPRRLSFSPGAHDVRPRLVLRRLSSTSAAAWQLGSGRPHCRPKPDVPPGVFPLGPRHW
jgi:hypothetical protein